MRADQEMLDEIDGPMLQRGLQGMPGKQIRLPSDRNARPDLDRLAQKFELFATR